MNVGALCRGLALALGLVASTAHGAEVPLVARARELGVARSLEWQRLLHYRPRTWGKPMSQVDGPGFLLSPAGNRDPEAELEATLQAFLLPLVPGHEDAHALCRFPARRRFLEQRLHFEGQLQAPQCPALARYMAEVDPQSVTIVYSANYLNNPASAFGHTFLRIERRRPAGSTETSERLDHGVDYIATTDTKNPVLYAFKGLTGMFPGVFGFHSFERKIHEYGNSEARDLWEYHLALRQDEVALLALHLWELQETSISYYYLSKNCSYQVLAVVEAAAPRIDLVAHLNSIVLPKDTIKALFTVPGLVRSVDYRPSLRSQFRAQVARLGSAQKDTVERLTLDPDAPTAPSLSLAESVAALDAAVFVLDARFARKLETTRDERVVAARARLVERREALSTSIPPPPPVTAPLDKAPQRGTDSMRLTLGTGATSQYGNGFMALGYRLALHDLADPPDGEPELSQLQFLDTRLRFDIARKALTLDRLMFAELLALNPITRYEHALSWQARAFGMRLHDRGCPDCFAHGLDLGLGGAVATEDEHLAFFVMADAYVAFSGSLDGIGGSFVRAGVGPYAGLRARLLRETLAVVTASWSYLPGASLRGTYDIRGNLRSALGRDVAIGFEGAVQPSSVEAQLASYLYF